MLGMGEGSLFAARQLRRSPATPAFGPARAGILRREPGNDNVPQSETMGAAGHIGSNSWFGYRIRGGECDRHRIVEGKVGLGGRLLRNNPHFDSGTPRDITRFVGLLASKPFHPLRGPRLALSFVGEDSF
jgi:hypothetical protein